MRIEIVNRQRAGRVPVRLLRALAADLMQAATRRGRPRTWSTLTLVLLGDRGIQAVNEQVFGRTYVTDVISQAYRPLPGPDAGWRGELFLNVQRAVLEGAARPGGPGAELALYLAHGCDHLTGGRDDTPARRAAMRRRETTWLRQLVRAGATLGPLVTSRP
jgi:rRNA maturation RNase YbeY